MAKKTKKTDMILPILSIVLGVLVIFKPIIFAWVVGAYLIITGALKLKN